MAAERKGFRVVSIEDPPRTYAIMNASGNPTRSRRPEYAHKVAWESVNGPVPTTPCPDGSRRWELHHSCMNRSCVNPDHIRLVTHREHVELHNELRAAIRLAKAA